MNNRPRFRQQPGVRTLLRRSVLSYGELVLRPAAMAETGTAAVLPRGTGLDAGRGAPKYQ